MIGPSIGGSERGLEKEREIQRCCLACACIQLLKVTSLYCLILPLSSALFSPCLSVYTVCPDAAARLRMTSHFPGAVNSITSKQPQYIDSEKDTSQGAFSLWQLLSDERSVTGRWAESEATLTLCISDQTIQASRGFRVSFVFPWHFSIKIMEPLLLWKSTSFP